MSIIGNGERKSFELAPGKKNSINVNQPVHFEITTVGGTVISGIVTPNNPLEVTPGDDIESYNIYIRDEILGKSGE